MSVKYPGPRFDWRVGQLRELKDNWDDEGAKAPQEQRFTELYALLNYLSEIHPIKNPAIGVSLEGGIQLMWSGCHISGDIDEKEITIYHMPNDEMHVCVFPNNKDSYKSIADLVVEKIKFT